MNFPELTLLHLVNLSMSFASDEYISPNLLYYLSKPKFDPGNFDYDAYYESLDKRIPFDQLGQNGYGNIRYAPQDRKILEIRSNLIANDNRAYSIAKKDYPTAPELEEFVEKKAGWSLSFAVKEFLMRHLDVAINYHGFVPFGAPVIIFLQSLSSPPDMSYRHPSHRDHVVLMNLTNDLARQYNVPSVVINNWMYIEGRKIQEQQGSRHTP